jgi:hypothetical protein
MGSGLAAAGFVVGPELTGAACQRCLFAAGLAGANAAFPIGVYWAGGLARGEGSFWLTVAAPWIVSATTVAALVLDKDYDGIPAFQIGAIGGVAAAPISIVLYELTHARRHARPAADSRPTIAVDPHRDGVALRVGGSF